MTAPTSPIPCSPARPNRRRHLGPIAFILGIALAGWVGFTLRDAGRPPAAVHSPEPVDDPEIARVSDTSIRASDFRAAWEKRSSDLGGDAHARATAVLEQLIRRELVFADARRTEFTERDDIRAAWKAFVVGRFRDELEARRDASSTLSESDIAAHYRDHASAFTSPERRRLAVIQVAIPGHAVPERRIELEREMDRVRDQALAEAGALQDFGAQAARHSTHAASRRHGGDVGWLTRAQAERAWPASVVEASFSLATPGEISPVVATDEGLFLIKLIERQDGRLASLDSVRERIRRELTRNREAEADAVLFDQLRSRHRVEVHPERLAALDLPPPRPEPSLAQQPPSLPAP